MAVTGGGGPHEADVVPEPPWVTERRARLDAAWREHVHVTEHLTRPDWAGEPVVLQNAAGQVCVRYIPCRWCQVGAGPG